MIDLFQGLAKGVGDWLDRRGRLKEAKLNAEIQMLARQAETIGEYDIEAQRAKRYTIMDEIAGLVVISLVMINFLPLWWPESAPMVDAVYERLENAPLAVQLPFYGWLASVLGLRWLVEAFIGDFIRRRPTSKGAG
jgi:hypothetical protein